MAYKLPPLPYDVKALEPHVSAKTMTVHYTKHHKGYVDRLNEMISGTDLEDKSLETIIQTASAKSDQLLFNNAAQAWNHTFFWNSMAPKPSEPSDHLASEIDKAFGGMDGLKRTFKKVATSTFGSGWTWLINGADGLEVISTSNADLPLVHGTDALICCDVWEHAYYLDYQNKRGDFVSAFLENLINWDFAAQNWSRKSSEKRHQKRAD
mgnify:CR=1 FL=1